MYLHLGRDVIVPYESIIGIFDLDNTTYCRNAAEFYNKAEKKGKIINIWDDIPRAAVIVGEADQSKVYISQLSTSTLLKRIREGSWNEA